jgi:hypothetical protein
MIGKAKVIRFSKFEGMNLWSLKSVVDGGRKTLGEKP